MRLIFSQSFAEFDRFLTAFAGSGFEGSNGADVAVIVQVIKFGADPGLNLDDFDVVGIGKTARGDLQVAFAEPLVHPNGCGRICRQQRIKFTVGGFQAVDVMLFVAIGDDIEPLIQLFGQANDLATQRNDVVDTRRADRSETGSQRVAGQRGGPRGSPDAACARGRRGTRGSR